MEHSSCPPLYQQSSHQINNDHPFEHRPCHVSHQVVLQQPLDVESYLKYLTLDMSQTSGLDQDKREGLAKTKIFSLCYS